MKNRNVVAVMLLPFITFGIYGLVWMISTKNEMNKLGAKIPSSILLFIPIANLFWLWNYSQGVEISTKGRMTSLTSFLLVLFLGVIGQAILQNEFNNVGAVDSSIVAPVVDETATPTVITNQPIVASGFVTVAPVVEAQNFTEQPVVEQPAFEPQTFAEQPNVDSVAQVQEVPAASEMYAQPVVNAPEVATTEQNNNNYQG